MSNRFRHLAPVSLYIALVSAVLTLIGYIVGNKFSPLLQAGLVVTILGLCGFALLDPHRLQISLFGQRAERTSNVTIMIVAFASALIVVNLLIPQNSPRLDLTADKRNSLSDETIQILSDLSAPVTARAFFTSQALTLAQAQQILEIYQYNSQGNFEFEIIDPETNPTVAKEAGIDRDGTIAITMGNLTELVTYPGEQEITTALVKLMSPERRVIYFLSGHQELDPYGKDETALAYARTALEAKNYTIAVLNLSTNPVIPPDASTIIIAGAYQPLAATEVDLLAEYLHQGGAVIFMLEPGPLVFSSADWQYLYQYLEQNWGITFANDVIVDQNSMFDRVIAIGDTETYARHSVTQNLYGAATLFPSSQAVLITNVPETVSITPLISTNQNAWGETDISSIQNGLEQFQAEDDVQGPTRLVVIAEDSQTNARIAVVGDSDFAVDANFYQYGNGDLLINLVDWSNKQENLISLPPRQTTMRTITPLTIYGMGTIFLVVLLLPLITLFLGGLVWLKRRRKG